MSVYVIGAGPAGMMAAIAAADNNNKVILLEKNEKIGKKLYITGKGRCNVTNNCVGTEFMDNVVTNKKFLYSALKQFNSEDTVELIESVGIKLKTERGRRVFPESDKSSDIIKAFAILLENRGVTVKLNENVTDLRVDNNRVTEIVTEKSTYNDVSALVIATGGISYSATGSTGDGYRFARKFGLSLVDPVPSLVGIHLSDLCVGNKRIAWEKLPKLQGLSLKNVQLSAINNGKTVCSEFGEMLFTDKGISGPIALTASARINRLKGDIRLTIDLKPALTEEVLDARLLREFDVNKNKSLKNIIAELVPTSLVSLIITSAEVDGEKKVNAVTREERKRIIIALKQLTFSYGGLEPIERAVVTAGGVSVSEINSGTMRCKNIENLYFAGEVLDIDALTGGYNIQIAMSTGYLAGSRIFTEE